MILKFYLELILNYLNFKTGIDIQTLLYCNEMILHFYAANSISQKVGKNRAVSNLLPIDFGERNFSIKQIKSKNLNFKS